MKRPNWNILGNMFEVKTRRSFKKAFLFSQRHYNKLYALSDDPYVADVFSTFQPVFDSFHNAFTQWNVLLGLHKGAVQDLNETLLTINPKLKQWEGKIFSHYSEGTEQAEAIFPRKRTPFYKGNYIVRTQAVAVLALALQNYPALAAVRVDVESFYALLDGKLQKRLEMRGAVKQQSTTLEQQRKIICTEMNGNLGLLMYHYRERPRMLKVLFDMGVIKNKVRRKKREKKKENTLKTLPSKKKRHS